MPFGLEHHSKNNTQANETKKKKIEQSAEQIYHLKKNAYKNYIKEIYFKINEELKKKNSYFNIVTSNLHQLSYGDALTTKEVKPVLKEEN